MPFRIINIIILGCLILISCGENKSIEEKMRAEQACMDRIIKQDATFGKVRNLASEQRSLTTSISNYTLGLKNMNFSECPKAFATAFTEHIYAWNAMKNITDKHPSLRGEMHELFDQIERSSDSTEFKILLKDIWDTWAAIEQVLPEKETN